MIIYHCRSIAECPCCQVPQKAYCILDCTCYRAVYFTVQVELSIIPINPLQSFQVQHKASCSVCSSTHLSLICVLRKKGGLMWKMEEKVFYTLSYFIDRNHISHQLPAPLFLCMNMDVEQHSHRLRSTGLCKTSDSSYLLHHRPPAPLTVQHFFNSSHIVS